MHVHLYLSVASAPGAYELGGKTGAKRLHMNPAGELLKWMDVVTCLSAEKHSECVYFAEVTSLNVCQFN